MEEEKYCNNCKHMLKDCTEDPCRHCQSHSKWESKENENKLCCNCKYVQMSYNEEPCCNCHNRSKWEQRNKFRTGDLVVSKNDNKETKSIYIYLRNKWVLYVPSYVVLRSNCDYRFSDHIDKLIGNSKALCSWEDNIEYASPEVITEHDDGAAKRYWSPKSLNDWLSELIDEKPDNDSWILKDPGLGYKDYGTRYDKFPNLNGNFIKNVIFRDPATIIFWEDGTKTVVKTQDGEKYDKEKGFAMAVCKKVFGNERDYYHVFKRWMRKGKEVK